MRAATPMTERVPPEILAEIFRWVHIYALNLFEPDEPVDGGRVFKLCWPVSAVSKYWRDVAISRPFLWTYLPRITVCEGDDYDYDDEEEDALSDADSGPLLETLKELISRAQDANLHPSFICTATAIEASRMGGVAIYLVHRCSQWRSVSISGIADCIDTFFWNMGGDMSRLEALRLEFLEDYAPRRVIDLPMFAKAPMLKFVHITGVDGWNIDLDTDSLVYLYDGVGGITHNIQTPDGFPKLTTLETHDCGFFDFSDQIEDDFTLAFPALKKLVYECHTSFPDEGFLLFPVTPSLEELSITVPEGDIIDLIEGMWDRSAKSLPLKSLRILENRLQDGLIGDLPRLLDKLPNLEVLEMAFPMDDDFESMAKLKGNGAVVPRLKKCTLEYHGDDFDELNSLINTFIVARCEPSTMNQKPEPEGLTTMELTFSNSLSPAYLQDRIMPGFADGQYGYLGIQPTRLEPWYKDGTVHRSAYTEAVATIPQMLYEISGREINVNTFDYMHTLELITRVEQKYKANELVNFLEANINICMISTAYALKTRLPDDNKDKNTQYRRVIRLLQKVKKDLTGRLDDFHWIWETSIEKVWIRYIPDDHEMRSDPDKFANAVLGITDDPWIIEDMRTL